PGAVDRLRSHRDPSTDGRRDVLVLAATDPANAYGLALPWPESAGRPARAAGAYVVLIDGEASLFLERSGRGLLPLRPIDGMWEADAVGALLTLVTDGRVRRLSFERVSDDLAPFLRDAGFVPTPKGLAWYGPRDGGGGA